MNLFSCGEFLREEVQNVNELRDSIVRAAECLINEMHVIT
jgi:hypothetical protein